MGRIFRLWISLLILMTPFAGQSQLEQAYLDSLRYSHDLTLPAWGPYTKKYIGVSHIPDIRKGLRFDLSVFPGFYRRKVDVPNVFFESGFHPWEASPNLEYFSFRHELEWKDRVYTDISYSHIDDYARLVRVEAVNNTDLSQSIVLHMMSSMHFPSIKEYNPDTPLEYSTISLPPYAHWVDALDYVTLDYVLTTAQDQLVYDGKQKGEVRDHGLVLGSGVGEKFGMRAGDQISFQDFLQEDLKSGILWIRYKMGAGEKMQLSIRGVVSSIADCIGTGEFEVLKIPLEDVSAGSYLLEITSLGGGESLILDGYTIVEEQHLSDIKLEIVNWNPVPEIMKGPIDNSLILKYENTDTYYGLTWDSPDYEVRKWHFKDLSDNFKRQVNSHVGDEFSDGTDGHFTNVFLRPINLPAHQTLVLNSMVCTGTLKEVEDRLNSRLTREMADEIYLRARDFLPEYEIVPEGEKYVFSNQRMAATTNTNVVFPVYTQRQYIRHHAPGRWWDCLYTWDAGFIGIGLTQQNIRRGIESLNAYLNEPDEQSAFIHHGTPLPVQHYLFLELWNKTQSREFLSTYYPKLKRYYDFIAGHNPTSTTRKASNLLSTWDYFYNSGGWDDYPPQDYLRSHPEERKVVTPVVSTAHCIRIAKILSMAATELGLEQDRSAYHADILAMGSALQNYAWDPAAGYFGYVVHDQDGSAKGILNDESKVNFNMGLDGASPLISGICNEVQIAQILDHLKTDGEIWSDIGLSAVDQSAPYYSKTGYWNGTVWMPHQWFFWKTMLDLGEAEFAYKIASTALDLWKREVESTYNCSEHFVIESGRGAGWHQFGGLSTPVLAWFNSYFRQGTLTAGFNVWIERQNINPEKDKLEAALRVLDDHPVFSVVVCLSPENTYQVYWNDKKIDHQELHKGTLSIDLHQGGTGGVLRVEKVGK